ncbi:MAG: histidine kinase [Tannerella sp.]|jgi:hypothetical protein|nr:histidine kinase [Tannerella sp.]
MRHFLPLLFILLFPLATNAQHAQPERWEHSMSHRYYGGRQGLGQMQAKHIFQDRHGYLWISNFSGVDRFDGAAFRNYGYDFLQGNTAFHICEHGDTMFFTSQSGISVLYPGDSARFIPFPGNFTVMDVMNTNNFYSDENTLYISNLVERNETDYHGKASIYKFDLHTETFTLIADRQYAAVIGKLDGKIFVFSNFGWWSNHDSDHPAMQIYRLENDRMQPVQTLGWGKYRYGYLFGNETGHLFWSREISPDHYSDISEITLAGDGSFRVTPLFQAPYFLQHIFSIDGHTVGFVTRKLESYLYSLRDRTVQPFPVNSLYFNHAIRDRENRLWFAAEDGVYACNNFEVETFQLGLAKNDNIWSVLRDRDGNTWFSTFGNGLWMAKPDGTLHRAVNATMTIDHGYMSNTTDRQGRIWLTSADGLLCYEPGQYGGGKLIRRGITLAAYYDSITGRVYAGGARDNMRYLVAVDGNLRDTVITFNKQYIICISRDGNRRLRIGTFADQYYLDETSQTVVRDTTPRPYRRGIIAMALDPAGTLWKGTQDGLFAENLQGTDIPVHPKTPNFVLCHGDKYVIWGGVGAELFVLDLKTFHEEGRIQIRTFTYYDGLDILECGQNGASIDAEGFVWLVAGDRVLKFHPDTLMSMPEPVLSPPHIVSVSSARRDGDRQTIDRQGIDREHPVRIARNANFLQFDILQAAINAPDSLRFRYRLLGYNEDWTVTATPTARSFAFQNVPFGTYRFEIQSSPGNGVWSESAFSPFLHINAPFWLTAPGLLLAGLALAGLTYFLFTAVQRRIARKQKEAQEIEQLRFHAIQHKFIPHFTRNVLNSVNYLITKNPEEAREAISDFANFSNDTLLNSDRFFWSLQEELTYIRRYTHLEQIRFADRLSYHYDIDPDVDPQMNVPMMILHTFCDNALKHGVRNKPGNWHIRIRIARENGSVVISVEDNGIGRAQASQILTEGTREGIKIVEKQIEYFNRACNQNARLAIIDLVDDNGVPCGTRSEVWI